VSGTTTWATSTLLAWHHADWMWLWGGLMIVIWVALIVAVVWLLVTPTGRDVTPPTNGPRDILAERYARGEINTDEHRERLEALR
jgi:putative membrane protein